MDRLEAWMTEGWNTPTAATPYVNWRYREYNKSADRICNIVMNTETDVFNNTPGKPPNNKYTHIFAQSDGGCRHKGKSNRIRNTHLQHNHKQHMHDHDNRSATT